MPFLCPTVNRFVLRLLAPSNNEFHSEEGREGLRPVQQRERKEESVSNAPKERQRESTIVPDYVLNINLLGLTYKILGYRANSASEQG